MMLGYKESGQRKKNAVSIRAGNLIAQTMNYICHKFQLKFMEAMAKISRIRVRLHMLSNAQKKNGLFIFIFALATTEISFIE